MGVDVNSTFTARRDGNLNDLLHGNGDREALNRANGVRSRAADGAWEPPVKVSASTPDDRSTPPPPVPASRTDIS